jgi:two-component system NtrC family sensor kinase
MPMEPFPATRVAILGGGKGGSALLDLLSQLPGVQIAGIADRDPAAPALQRARNQDIPATDDVLDLIANHGVNLIIDVTGDPAMRPLLERHKSPEAEVLGGAAAKLLWKIIQHESQLQAQVFQSEKLAGIGSFAAGIAHDINNPLHLVLGYAESILEERDVATIHEHCKEIIHAVHRISPICKDLTQYARRSTADELMVVDLNAKLDEALKIAQYATVLQNLSIVKDYTPDSTIEGTPEEFLHAFVNLITNAIQAMEGTGVLSLKTRCHEGTVTVAIGDSGCGIPRERLEQIFEPFFTTKAPGKGTGLGLYNVRSIVNKHRGKILVESEVGKGTTFRLLFPQASAPG